MNLHSISLSSIIGVQLLFSQYCVAQDVNIENQVVEILKRAKIDKEIKSGIKDFYIGKDLIGLTVKKLEQGSIGECEYDQNYNSFPSGFSRAFQLNKDSYNNLRNYYNQISCQLTVFGKDNKIVLGVINTPNKSSNDFTIYSLVIAFRNVDPETINLAMIEKWGKPVKQLKSGDKTNPQICQEIAPIELIGKTQFQRCVKQLNDNPLLSKLTQSNTNSLLFESSNSYSELTHSNNQSLLVIQHRNFDTVLSTIVGVLKDNENKLESDKKKKLSKDF